MIKTQELSLENISLSDNLKDTVILNVTTSLPVNQVSQNDPNNKKNPSSKNIAHSVIKVITLCLHVLAV